MFLFVCAYLLLDMWVVILDLVVCYRLRWLGFDCGFGSTVCLTSDDCRERSVSVCLDYFVVDVCFGFAFSGC